MISSVEFIKLYNESFTLAKLSSAISHLQNSPGADRVYFTTLKHFSDSLIFLIFLQYCLAEAGASI